MELGEEDVVDNSQGYFNYYFYEFSFYGQDFECIPFVEHSGKQSKKDSSMLACFCKI